MPRRAAITGTDKSAGVPENLRIQYDGDAIPTGKNEMDNPILTDITPEGNLKGWELDNPPEEVGFGVYAKGPNHAEGTRQATLLFEDDYYEQKGELVTGSEPPDVAHRVSVAPFSFPPKLELVAAAQWGFPQGWWAWTYAYGIGPVDSGYLTQVAPLSAFFANQGQGFQIPLGGNAPDGVTHVVFGAAGPFPTELEALNTPKIFQQKTVETIPRIPAFVDMQGPYMHDREMSFYLNLTQMGTGAGNRRRARRKKKKSPGRTTRETETTGRAPQEDEEDDD